MPVSASPSSRGWVGWVVQNKALAGGLAFSLVVLTGGVIAVAGHSDKKGDKGGNVAALGSTTSSAPGETTASTGATVSSVAGPAGSTRVTTKGGKTIVTTGRHSTGGSVGGVQIDTSCSPAKGYTATGINETEIRIAQIVTDVSQLPAQLYPNREGLYALVQAVNAKGGVCGRKIAIDYTNDQFATPIHQNQYQAAVNKDFAFVANSALGDGDDYSTTPPFNPTVKDSKGEYVPDIGGLAYSYYRAQSPWHAGVVGSLSPSLVGGLAFKTIVQEAGAGGGGPTGYGPCRKAAIEYLDVPNNYASEDQAINGRIALEKDWGANLGAGNVEMYHQPLAAPQQFYESDIATMKTHGVNCIFTYSDLGSNITLFKAMKAQGVWPPSQCGAAEKAQKQCFALAYMPFSGYDPSFLTGAGDAGMDITSFIPHAPFTESATDPALKAYADTLKQYPAPEHPASGVSTFSLIGYTSGVMFVAAVQACGAAPTRACVMNELKGLKNFTAGGLLGGSSPFRSTRVKCTSSDCGRGWTAAGTFDFKWIFNCSVGIRVIDKNKDGHINPAGNSGDNFYRIAGSGFACDDTLRIARGSPG